MTGTVSIRREAAISVGINGALSLAFFLALFGTQPRLRSTFFEPSVRLSRPAHEGLGA